MKATKWSVPWKRLVAPSLRRRHHPHHPAVTTGHSLVVATAQTEASPTSAQDEASRPRPARSKDQPTPGRTGQA